MHGPAYHKIMAQRKKASEKGKKLQSAHIYYTKEDSRSNRSMISKDSEMQMTGTAKF